MATRTIPATVEIPTDLLMNTIAQMYALEELLARFNGTDSEIGESILESTTRLLAAVAPTRDREREGDFYDSADPIVVEAHARGWERYAEYAAGFRLDPTHALEKAAEIREVGYAFPDDSTAVAQLRGEA